MVASDLPVQARPAALGWIRLRRPRRREVRPEASVVDAGVLRRAGIGPIGRMGRIGVGALSGGLAGGFSCGASFLVEAVGERDGNGARFSVELWEFDRGSGCTSFSLRDWQFPSVYCC